MARPAAHIAIAALLLACAAADTTFLAPLEDLQDTTLMSDTAGQEAILVGMAQAVPAGKQGGADSTDYFDKPAIIAKAAEFIRAAGKAGVKLLGFSESFVPGYPWFNWWTSTFDITSNERIEELFALNAPMIGTDDLQPIFDAAKEAGVNVVLPITERDNQGGRAATLNTAVFISSEGKLIGRHRKTVPSYTERFWWTNGDGTDIVAVDMPGVGRVCALLCWEAYVLLARYTLYAQACEFLVIPTQDIGPVWTNTISFIAREGRMVVMSEGQMMKPEKMALSPMAQDPKVANYSEAFEGMVKDFQGIQEATNNAAARGYFMDGGAIIAGYNGKILAGPVFSNIKASVDKAKEGCPSDPAYVGLYGDHEPCKFIEVPGYDADEEFILAAPVSRGDILAAKTYQDNVGNYARTDIWEVLWHNKRRSYMTADAPAGNGLKPEEESLGVGLKPEEGKGGAKADAPAPKDA